MSFIMKNLGSSEINTSKTFTIEEVNACLPEVEKAYYRLLQMNAQVNHIIHQLKSHEVMFNEPLSQISDADQDEESIDNLSSLKVLLSAIQQDMHCISKHGGAIHNIEDGIVNWNGITDEKPVIFSWKLGEKTIQFWQDNCTSIDRKPLDTPVVDTCN